MWNDPVGRVRMVGLCEGISFLVLLLIAMPLKYFAGRPEAVFTVGWLHGVLFMAYASVTFWAWGRGYIRARMVGLAALAALIPLGPFLLDPKLKAIEAAQSKSPEQIC